MDERGHPEVHLRPMEPGEHRAEGAHENPLRGSDGLAATFLAVSPLTVLLDLHVTLLGDLDLVSFRRRNHLAHLAFSQTDRLHLRLETLECSAKDRLAPKRSPRGPSQWIAGCALSGGVARQGTAT